MSVLELVREDLRGFTGYGSARSQRLQGDVWLNANESAWPGAEDPAGTCRRYPEPQPPELTAALARVYGCAPEQVLVGRGSDEAIDLLVRALCRPGRDAVAVTPPVFGMYAVSARLQGAPLLEVPLVDGEDGFAPDLDALADASIAGGTKLVFLCSPGNPTGNLVPVDAIAALARRLEGRALLVIDEAYGEFSSQPSAITLMAQHPNLAVLRTLSKAHALAGARIGAVIAAPELIAVLRRCQAPYPVPAPCVDIALAALSPEALEYTHGHVELVCSERERLRPALEALPGVRRVYRSEGNFLLVRLANAKRAFQALLEAGVVVRDQRGACQLDDALRITVGTPAQNDRVVEILSSCCTEPSP
ncbi:histidinol-phosphate transaminase [Luteimonas sp. MJ293]|uniref:histidinol-phosphate transaminase n=1 Tax=Luteimonas sp. MJ146 TaxID=3129240 RepID=UPI0031BAA959